MPSAHSRFRSSRMRPSPVRWRRSWATGGRSRSRQRCASRARFRRHAQGGVAIDAFEVRRAGPRRADPRGIRLVPEAQDTGPADFTVTMVHWLDPRSDERWGRRTGTSRSSTTRPWVYARWETSRCASARHRGRSACVDVLYWKGEHVSVQRDAPNARGGPSGNGRDRAERHGRHQSLERY